MIQSYAVLAIAWVILLILSILGYICYICCCVCDKCCPPSKCCRRNYKKKPITKCETNFPIIVLFLASGILVGIGITGLVTQSGMPNAIQNI